MPKPRKPPKVALTVRIDAQVAARLRGFVADYCGKPLRASLGGLVAQAVTREMDRLELVLAGALPADRVMGGDAEDDPAPSQPQRQLNASPR